MREIIFRGKAYYSGEWYYGSLIRDHSSRTAGICIYVELPKNENFFGHLSNCNIYRVDPETVGQGTRLKDKNNKQIYEGGIVTVPDNNELYVVQWDEFAAKFVIYTDGVIFDLDNYFEQALEVIGNFYDNPELIGGNQNG